MSERELTEKKKIIVNLRNMGTVNKNVVSLSTDRGRVNLYFSYETLVAVDEAVSKNVWSKTTGKMLNDIQSDKSLRIDNEEVIELVQKRLSYILGFSDDRGEVKRAPKDEILDEQKVMGVQ